MDNIQNFDSYINIALPKTLDLINIAMAPPQTFSRSHVSVTDSKKLKTVKSECSVGSSY
jgi:hypothetical protein